MNTQRMMESLIGGDLIRILEANPESAAFMARDDRSPTGYVAVYQPLVDEADSVFVIHTTPQNASDGAGVIEESKMSVEIYLMHHFQLTESEAHQVVDEAHVGLFQN